MRLEQKLIILRKRHGLTQSNVAEKLNVSRQAISRWESGVASPTIENLKGLSSLYGVSVDMLLNEQGESTCQVQHEKTEDDKILIAIVMNLSYSGLFAKFVSILMLVIAFYLCRCEFIEIKGASGGGTEKFKKR